ncbi:hypothetical protein JQX13_38195 [Archangium violaceum]|uniref:hypothetical protein n=1 Tax=Archangium violaceum TaxID=83451 RepID=UPI00193B0BF7|nr:hypothetical protein [Archangium violaceum]QRK05926.1 hypothetical protein JQX13_38195 [Archangium violaceum]
MSSPSLRRVFAALLFLCIAGCERKLSGPAPALSAVAPLAVCGEQLTTEVVLSGDSLSPLVSDGLTGEARVNLPQLTLVQARSISGEAGTGAQVALPDDAANPSSGRVRWSSDGEMRFDIFPELGVAPGLYTVRAENRNGQSVELAESLLVVPRPSLTEVRPDLVCSDQGNTVTLTGDFFIRSASATPTVTFDGMAFAPASMADCRALPGKAGLEACRALTVSLPAKSLEPRGHQVKVTNPATVACGSTESVTFTLVPEPTLAKVEADLVCTAQGENTLTVTGTGFITVDAATPTLILGTLELPTVASDCTGVSGPRETVTSCTTLTAVLPPDGLSPGTYDVRVKNPVPADCATSQPVKFTVVPPPSVAAVEPDLACAAEGGVLVAVKGSGFLTVDGRLPSVKLGSLSLTPTPADCTPVEGPTETVHTCGTLNVTVPQGTDVGTLPVSVLNPAPAACSSSESVNFVSVPPPAISAVTPDVTCAEESSVDLMVEGSNFLTVNGTLPVVKVGSLTLDAPVVSNCTPVMGALEAVTSCSSLKVTVPRAAASGELAVTVSNPAPAGCTSTSRQVYLAPAPVLIAATPPGICKAATTEQTITLKGSGFLGVGGATPGVTIGTAAYTSALVSGSCEPLAGYSQALERCSELTFSVSPGSLAEGSSLITVRNPAPAACGSTQEVLFNVTSPPTLTGSSPNKVCSAGGKVDLVGSHFVPGMVVRLLSPTPMTATGVTVSADGNSAQATFSGPLPPGGPYDIEIVTAAGGCEATVAAVLSVTDGPTVFFADPPVVYNGITTQATLYASGFSAEGLQVQVRPSGTAEPFVTVPSQYNPSKANRILFTVAQETPAGSYDVRVVDGATTTCPGELTAAFKVVDQTTLRLTSIQPPFGSTLENTAVELSADATVGGGLQGLPRFYLNPATAGAVAVPLESVAVNSTSKATAVVPSGQLAGLYDVIVVNPDGAVGVLDDAYTILADKLPGIATVNPGSLLTGQSAAAFEVKGENFRTPAVALRCLDGSTGAITTVPATVASVDTAGTLLQATVDSSSFANGQACVVRVTNADTSYAEYSSLVFTNAAQKLTAFNSGPALGTPRRAPVAAGGRATSAAQFLYVLGGDNGTEAGAYASVESAPLDIFGLPSGYFPQPNALTVPRTRATGQRVGDFLYVAGGRDASGVHTTVERAFILKPKDKVNITDLDVAISTEKGLPRGVYFYRVAAVMGSADAFNPDGENLPSDPFPVSLPALEGRGLVLTVRWAGVSGAVKYRVYRTTADARAGTERLLAEVPSTQAWFTDDGSLTPGGASPLPIGATGRWSVVAHLTAGRDGATSVVLPGPADTSTKTEVHYLYVLGGKDETGNLLGSYDLLPITLDTATGAHTLGTLTAGSSTFTARWQHGAFAAPLSTGQYIYVAGGFVKSSAGESTTSTIQVAKVGTGGALEAWGSLGSMNPSRAGFVAIQANNTLFAFCGQNGSASADSTQAVISSSPPALDAWSNTRAPMSVARYLPGGTLHGAFIYVVGGRSDTGITSTTEQIIW